MGQITVTQHEGYVEYRLLGAFDDDNAHQTLNDLWTAADYEFTHNELYDYSLADFTQLTGAGIRKIVHLRERLNTDKLQLPTAMLVSAAAPRPNPTIPKRFRNSFQSKIPWYTRYQITQVQCDSW